ncbi:MAG: hypothetical protein ACJAQZ_002996, partial [Planctomycetota bacterium]
MSHRFFRLLEVLMHIGSYEWVAGCGRLWERLHPSFDALQF